MDLQAINDRAAVKNLERLVGFETACMKERDTIDALTWLSALLCDERERLEAGDTREGEDVSAAWTALDEAQTLCSALRALCPVKD